MSPLKLPKHQFLQSLGVNLRSIFYCYCFSWITYMGTDLTKCSKNLRFERQKHGKTRATISPQSLLLTFHCLLPVILGWQKLKWMFKINNTKKDLEGCFFFLLHCFVELHNLGLWNACWIWKKTRKGLEGKKKILKGGSFSSLIFRKVLCIVSNLLCGFYLTVEKLLMLASNGERGKQSEPADSKDKRKQKINAITRTKEKGDLVFSKGKGTHKNYGKRLGDVWPFFEEGNHLKSLKILFL